MIKKNLATLEITMINREISWLSFNERVLQEAQDPNTPLIERFRFLGIYSNNMDEFFRVRVANIKRMISTKRNEIQGFEGTAAELLEKIRKIVIAQQKDFESCYFNLITELEKEGIFQLRETNLSTTQKKELITYFHKELKHVIVPIILKTNAKFPKLRDKNIYLAVKMHTTNKPIYALIQIPSNYPRFYRMSDDGKNYFILLDDIIRLNLEAIFPIFDFEKIEAYTFKFTRDAELNLDDDLSVSFVEKLEKSLKNRKKGEPVRFVYDHEMPVDLQHFLLKSLNLKSGINTIPGGRYHNFKDFSRFPDFGKKELVYKTQEPLIHHELEGKKSLIKTILEKDVLLHFPYQSFDYVVDILREAAIDPFVKSIKINIYRVTQDSQVLNALMNAVSNGKEVVVVFELKARFDEENNINWAERLREHGAKVVYGYKDLKVHSKLFQITRIFKGKEQLISYVGTGNFHEKTARVYTDMALLTSRVSISNEVKRVFRLLENISENTHFTHLMISPFNNRRRISAMIQQEINSVKKGGNGLIQMKLNNLVDVKLIEKLYEASKAGVKIQLIVRGVCCLVPGIKHKSENIEVISIVSRYLEHTRFMIFHSENNSKYFLTSADIMERNLDRRIEVAVPIQSKNLQENIQFLFDKQWNDNVKARIVDKKQKNKFRPQTSGEIHNAQVELYQYYQEKANLL
jgi:polyphosphate kinase